MLTNYERNCEQTVNKIVNILLITCEQGMNKIVNRLWTKLWTKCEHLIKSLFKNKNNNNNKNKSHLSILHFNVKVNRFFKKIIKKFFKKVLTKNIQCDTMEMADCRKNKRTIPFHCTTNSFSCQAVFQIKNKQKITKIKTKICYYFFWKKSLQIPNNVLQ